MRISLRRSASVATCVPALFAACATLNTKPDYERLDQHVQQALGGQYACRPEDEAASEERVALLQEGGITADEAVEIALLNNPRLQAQLLDVGIGRAEVVQAGLFSNPGFALALRFPDGGGLADLEMSLAQNIAELWQIPIRQRAAQRDLDRIIVQSARAASATALDARAAYFRAVGADREQELALDNLAITQQLVDLAIARREAGSGSEVDVNLTRSQHMDSELQARSAALAAVEARADLVELLGLESAPSQIKLAEALSDPAPVGIAPERLIALAREHRLDLRAVAHAVDAAQARVDLEKTRFLRSIELGVASERFDRPPSSGNWLTDPEPEEEHDSQWIVGPSLAVEIPLFDQNQAQIKRAELEYQQAARVLKAIDRELIQEAHAALERSRTAAETARFYRDSVLPLREQGLKLTQEAYRAGQLALLSVLEAQRSLLAARSEYVKTLQAAAIALVDLERVAGQPASNLLGAVPAAGPEAQAGGPNTENAP
jgi:cobalt-zinc-cadmium efflux system outer membrane protein